MNTLPAVLLSSVLVSTLGCVSNPHVSPDNSISKLFFARLKQLSGVDARDCGVVPLKDLSGPDASGQLRTLTCSNQALSDRKSFWAAFRIPGYEDTSFWEGIALTPGGKLVKVTYQYDLSDPAMEKAGGSVREFNCQSVTLDSGVGSVVVCELSANNSFKPEPLRGSA